MNDGTADPPSTFSERRQAWKSLRKTPGGRIYVGVRIGCLLYVALLVASFSTLPDHADHLLAMTVLNVFLGRGGGMAYGHSVGCADVVVVAVNGFLETVLLLLFYSLFHFSWHHLLKIPALKGLMARTRNAAERNKGLIRLYGPMGLLAFVVTSFAMTGPMVSTAIGVMLDLPTRTILSCVLGGTYVSYAGWAFELRGVGARLAAFDIEVSAMLILVAAAIGLGWLGQFRHRRQKKRVVMRLIGHVKLGWRLWVCGLVWTLGRPCEAAVDFNRDVRPVLADNCFECHGPDAARRKAGLRLDTREGIFGGEGGMVVTPGDPEASELVRRVTSADPGERMPPEEAHRRPTAAQIDLLREWVAEGAPYAEHWAFVAPKRPALPKGADPGWGRNGIDGFVSTKLSGLGWQPQPEADRAALIRRLSLDLLGLPPTPDEVSAFFADRRPGAYRRLVDRLLASPRFGEHFAWGWMEAARYADTDGFQSDAERHMWRWREWVIEALNRNLPYDRFTIEQLAGDLLPEAGLEQRLATGFNRNHRYDKGSGTVQAESIFENAADRLETTATVWMGMTMNCARCHDHKFDPVTSREYYEMLAFFDKVPENGQAILFNSHPRLKTPTAEQSARLTELDRQSAATEAALVDLEPEIERQMRDWASGLGDALVERPLFRDGLADLFHLDGLESKGKQRQGKVRFVPGVRGKAMAFGDGPYFEFDRKVGNLWGRDEFTLAFWFRLDDLGDGTLISELDDPEDLRLGTVVDVRDGRLRFMLSHRWNYAVTWFELRQQLEVNRWYHFAVTCDGRVQLLSYRAYLDGEEAVLRVIQDSAVDGKKVNVPLYLGWNPLGSGFRGALDELRFQRRVLEPSQVAALSAPRSLREIVKTPELERTASERSAMKAYFLEHVAAGEVARVRSQFLSLQRERRTLLDALPTTMVMVDDPDAGRTRVRLKGQYDQLGESVAPETPGFLPPFPPGQPRNRLGLARWLMSPDHPLTARVTVNRIWQHFFGAGFVDSPENIGTQCAEPVHVELLDWLATELMRREWDVKSLIRLVVTSATYRQSSGGPENVWARDPQNRFLGRGPRHRLAAPVLRDQALALAGLLVERFGGASVYPYQPGGLWKLTSNKGYEMSAGADLYRRSLYTFWRRSIAPPSMKLFDASDREFCNVAARRTNTPLQALAAMNEQSFYEAARSLGGRIFREGGGDDQARARYAFRLILSREASDEELRVMLGFLDDVRSEEERFALLANMLLNTDKAQTKE